MSIIALLISISLTIALIFLGVFLWSLKSGQHDDTYTPSVRILFDQNLEFSNKILTKNSEETNEHVK